MASRLRLTQRILSRNGAAFAALAVILVGGVVAGLVVFQGGKTKAIPPTTPQKNTISLSDRTWHCRGPVDLALVRVVLHGGRRDAVHLDPGCTGSIQRLEVVGNGGSLGGGADGVKVHPGAHDLQVLGGFIDCGAKAKGKHQDAIQAMGGHNVVFKNITSKGCSNSFMFINWGQKRKGIPTGILCIACRATSHNYSIFVGHSIRSGALNSSFVSRVKPRLLSTAVNPVSSGNSWAARR